MSREEEIKQEIKEAIQQFANGNLSENAIALFNKLGYSSNKKIDFTKAEFERQFAEHQTANAQKTLFDDWLSADYLFQLTEEEITRQKSLFSVNQYNPNEYQSYSFVAIELKNEHYARGRLSQITREVNKLFPMPVMILFKHVASLTLSVINRRLHKRDDSKDVLKKVTLIKDIRISHAGGGVRRTEIEIPLKKGGEGVVSGKGVVTRNEGAVTHRAHIEILFDLSFDALKNKHGFTNFMELHEAWQKTLDTRELNKRFFKELANWYFWATQKVEFPDDAGKDKEVRNATSVIRLITRLIFVWFLKEKGLVPDELFDEKQLKKLLKYTDNKKSTYYKAILQNLFFATLNTEMGKRRFRIKNDSGRDGHYFIHNVFRYENEFVKAKETLEQYFAPIPFLNGGLFECLDKELDDKGKLKRIRIDGFSDRVENVLEVPDELFFNEKGVDVNLSEIYGSPKRSKEKVRGLIDILNSYKFTVTENTPIEEEIALDPELLGKVFENLLASYNPETQTTARKQTGSFYTPREIVNYMVDESLIAYLSTAGIPADSTASIPAGGNDYNYPFFNPYGEIKIHQGNLPHWQQEDVFYFVTFRLADSIPKEKVDQLRQERETWLKNHPKNKEGKYSTEELKEYYRLFSKRVEEWLDKGAGSCILREEKYAQIIADALLCFNNQRYILDKWVVMPNHVHVLVKPLKNYNLTDILHSWKSYTANEINKYAGGKGQLWMHESYDHIVRNREAFEAIRNYIRQNPAKAGITLPDCAKSWTESTANSPVGGGIPADSCSPGGIVRSIVRSKDAPDTEARLRKLLSYSDEPHDFTEGETKLILSAIDNCKILDPACGSGAFPMGILHKLVHILHKLDPRNELWKQRQIDKALQIDDPNIRDHATQDIEEAFDNNELDYGRKLYLIENCIYGVDIQPIAVQIAKLRFFISLIVDQKVNPNRDNLGIRPLPNLETKFVAANTLIGLEKEQANLFTNPNIEKKKTELKKVRHDYFEARTPKRKENCRIKDKQLRDELAELLIQNHDFQPATAKKIAAWDPYDQNASSPFFDPEWMFGLKEGFDVVIGNPPYGGALSKTEIEYFKANYSLKSSETAILFIEKGNRILQHSGILSYIIPKSYTFASNYTAVRHFTINDLAFIVDCGKAFENVLLEATVFQIIKNKSLKYYKSIQLIGVDFLVLAEIDKRLVDKYGLLPNGITDAEIAVADKLTANKYYLNDIATNRRGTILLSLLDIGKFPVIGGKEIDRFGVRNVRGYINEDLHGTASEIKANSILVQGIVAHIQNPVDHIKITACLPEDNSMFIADNINQIILTKNSGLTPACIRAILNSTLINWFVYLFIYGKGIRTLRIDNPVTSRIPIPKTNSKQLQPFEFLTNYSVLSNKHNQERNCNFFERLIDAMVYELYLEEEVKTAGCEVLKHLTKLPQLKYDWSDEKKLQTIEKVYKELSDSKHPVSMAMAKMQEIPEIKLIEGKR